MESDPYVGLIVSLHGSLLYSRYRAAQPGAAEFLAEQEALRSRLIEGLARDPNLARHTGEDALGINRDMLFGWDVLSLFVSHGSAWQDTFVCPTDYAGGRAQVKVRGGGERWWLEPFPFRAPLELSIAVTETADREFRDQDTLRQALVEGRRRQLTITLEPD